MRKVLLIFTVLMGFALLVQAQTKAITGKVIDTKKEPLIGVSVNLKGTSQGVVTDVDGNYRINVPSSGSAVLVFKYLGFKTTEVAVGNQNQVNVTLTEDSKALDEVVIIGYGQAVKKSDLTGSVGVVSGADIARTPVPNVAEALTGKVAGLQVIASEGSPDAEIKVRLRGGGSISQDNSPLYIVDGFPVPSINNIASSDIENLTFLKDAASTAIYGSRAANGVILVTTKSGKAGKISVTANAFTGVRNITKQLNVLSPYEYVLYQYELDQTTTFQNYYGVYQDLDIYKSVAGRNWQNEVFGRSAPQYNINVGVNGGTRAIRFNLGLNRNKEESIMIGSGYDRNNLNFKINADINSKLSLDFNTRLSYTTIDGAGVNVGSGANTRLRNSVKYAPTRGLREFDQNIDADGSIDPESQSLLFNPVQSALDEYKRQNRFSSNFNGGLKWNIIKGLSLRSEGGYEFNNDRTDNVWGPATSNAKEYAGQPIGRIFSQGGNSYRISNYFTFDKPNIIKGHNLSTTVGQELISSGYKTVTDEARFFPLNMKADDVLANMNFGTPLPSRTYISPNDRLSSYFARVNYDLFDKYLISATVRADGSSKFAEGNRWGYFPSVALGWKISEENFIKDLDLGWLSQLKLRASYGSTGNNRIQNGAWQLNYITDNENKPYFRGETESSNFIPSAFLYNPNLKWETTINRNLGLDFGLLSNRISGTIDAYFNTTKDLLVQAPIAQASGFAFQYQNFGSTSNKGIELTLDGTIVRSRDFRLSASFNIGFNKNRVEEFKSGDANFKAYTSGWNGTAQPLEDYIIRQGQPLGQMYGYVTDGMYSFNDFTYNTTTRRWDLVAGVPDNSTLISANYFGPGTLKFKDISGPAGTPDGKIDNFDKTVIGNANPTHTGGFNLNARYKGFDLIGAFNWTVGNNIYNANRLDFSSYLLSRRYQNLTEEMSLANRFTIIDPATGNNVASGQFGDPAKLQAINQNASIWHPLMTQTPLHSWAVEDGSFLRLNTLTFGYTLPASLTKRVGVGSVRLYTSAYNLFVLTNYSGYDPEVDTRRNPPVTPGVDYSAYPKSRSFIGGINVTF
jgi:TonB-dependent starch-binding outer membrane protein SusC